MHSVLRAMFLALASVACSGCADQPGLGEPTPGSDGTGRAKVPTPEFGAVEVLVLVTGPVYAATGPSVILTIDWLDLHVGTIAPTGGKVRIGDLPTGTHQVRLEPFPRGCLAVHGNPQEFMVRGGRTSRVEVAVDCSIRTGELFQRMDPYSSGSGMIGLSERYTIRANGTFLLQAEYVDLGRFEMDGTWSMAGPTISLLFAQAGYTAAGILLGNCLAVSYGAFMIVDGFENAEYCR